LSGHAPTVAQDHPTYNCAISVTSPRSGLGTSRKQAIFTAISRKSYWHLSKTLATQSGMTNKWLQEQGLLSIRALWMKAHGYA
jgi:hypothetical protein